MDGLIYLGYLNIPEDILLTNNSINVSYKDTNINVETLKEQIVWRDDRLSNNYYNPREYTYIYATDGSKIYFDPENNGLFRLTTEQTKAYLANPENTVVRDTSGTIIAGDPNNVTIDSGYVYRKVSIPINSTTGEYIEVFQGLNGNNTSTTRKRYMVCRYK